MPDELIVENDRLVGIRFRRTRMENGRPVPTDEFFERRGAYVISSIGSIPEPIEGVDMKGELFDFVDWDLGRLEAYPTVFAAGNVATGKGNIIASRKHARLVSEPIAAAFLGLNEDGHAGEEAMSTAAGVRDTAGSISGGISRRTPISASDLEALRDRVRKRQQAVGYDGDFNAWIEQATPPNFI